MKKNEFDFIIFTDGSAKMMKKEKYFLASSAAIVFDIKKKRIYKDGKVLPEKTSQYAELYGIYIGFNIIETVCLEGKKKDVKVLIVSDSKYSIDTFTKYVYSWSKHREDYEVWMSSGKKIKNQSLIKRIFFSFINQPRFTTEFIHINSHKKFTDSNIELIRSKISKQGYDISKETVKCLMKYNDEVDKICTKYRVSGE